MGRYEQKIDEKCHVCGADMVRISVKNPFIDDYEDECSDPRCNQNGQADRLLNARTRSAAREAGC